jgi:hypothetical protein
MGYPDFAIFMQKKRQFIDGQGLTSIIHKTSYGKSS